MRFSRHLATVGGLALTLAACGGSEVTVQVLQSGADDQLQPVADLPVEFLPFDRDSLFEALAARAPEPEPQIPEDLRMTFDTIQTLQTEWREAEQEWAETRDELQRISERLQGMDRRSREYRELFERFTELEEVEARLDRQKEAAFTAFDTLQQRALARADSMRAVILSWEDIAFSDYVEIQDSILEAVGRAIKQDTTDADGIVTRTLSGGPWWAHARLNLPSTELYWNEMFQPAEVDTLRLEPGNAEERLRL